MGKAVFITGTDTGVGKTLITGLLGRYLSEGGLRVITQKWVQTGSPEAFGDMEEHLRLMGLGKSKTEGYLKDIIPYTFGFPASPHLAASIEGQVVDIEKIKRSFFRLRDDFDAVLVEGSGGLMVPLSGEKVIADVVSELDLPVLLVVGNKLGAINHALLTIEALRKRDLEIVGAVFNRIFNGEDERVLDDNPKIISKLTGVEVIYDLPYSEDKETLYMKFKEALACGKCATRSWLTYCN